MDPLSGRWSANGNPRLHSLGDEKGSWLFPILSMTDRLAGGQVQELQVLACRFIAKHPNSLVVDDLQIHRIGIAEVGNVAESFEVGLPQLLLLLEIESNHAATRPRRHIVGIYQNIAAGTEDGSVIAREGKDLLAIIHHSDNDVAELVLRSNQFNLIIPGKAQLGVCDNGLLLRELPGSGIGHFLVVLGMDRIGESQCTEHDQNAEKPHGIHGNLLKNISHVREQDEPEASGDCEIGIPVKSRNFDDPWQSGRRLVLKESRSPADHQFGQGNDTMLDDIQRLRNSPPLLQLLSHYAAQGKETWTNRLTHLDGVDPSELVKLHGELIAFSWADQNTGQVPCCYRVTASGLKAIQQVNGGVDDDGEVLPMPEKPEKSFPKFAKKKREKAEPVAEAA